MALLLGLLAAGAGDFGELDLAFWTLAVFVLLGELFPIQVHGQVGEETFSTPFGFAMLLIYGVPEVAVVQVLATLAADLSGRRPPDRIVFNLAQLTLSWGAAGAALALAGGTALAGDGSLEASDLPAIALAAVVFFAVNSTLVRTAEALLQRTPIGVHLKADLVFRSWSAATLFALGPPVAVIAQDWLYLVPALALPMAAVHRASQQASEMERLALQDTLTGLPNRTLLADRARRAIRAAPSGDVIAILSLDLDRFRDVNDTFGRAQGDALLIEVAARLTRSVRAGDTVARTEGDKFGVLIPGIPRASDAERAARNILLALSRPLELAGATLSVDASIGIACFPNHGSDDPDLLLQRADAAMYRSKRAQSRLEVYSSELDEEAPRRLALITALKAAIDRREIELYYQPKLELGSGRLVGVEALARWTDDRLGAVAPATFVPLAERTGLADPFTELVMEMATADARRWRDQGYTVPVAVNVSTVVLLDPHFPERLEAQLRRAGLERGAVEVEITESSFMGDHDAARAALERLRAMGVRTAIDDFGTGYSSLAYLRELPVHALKIDRSFVASLGEQAGAEAIVRSVVELARNLHLETVAEGVEDVRVCDRLARLGCDAAQGFGLAQPMPAAELLDWLAGAGSVDQPLRHPADREPP